MEIFRYLWECRLTRPYGFFRAGVNLFFMFILNFFETIHEYCFDILHLITSFTYDLI
jgi:hypothetical protein